MSGGVKELKDKQFLFREGDPSDAAYVIKSGRIVITKAKGSSEIVLAELGPGSMLGEMAFFDGKPRSAGARAQGEANVIVLPFNALNAQFTKFPEWLKVMVKTINQHLRDANMRIKNLESGQKGEEGAFDPYTITRLTGILTLVASKFGEKDAEGILVPSGVLRKYTIQVFQQPTNKMQKLMETYQAMGHMVMQDLGEGRMKIVIKSLDMLSKFVDFYNDWLFTEEKKREDKTIEEKELIVVKALLAQGKQRSRGEDGMVQVSLTKMQNESMATFGQPIRIDEVNSLIEKKLVTDKMQGDQGEILTKFKPEDLETIFPYWQMIYALKKVR